MNRINVKDRLLLLGLSLGDAHIRSIGRYELRHGAKQKSYLEHKANLIYSLLNKTKIPNIREYLYGGHSSYNFSIQHGEFIKVRKKLYQNNKKRLTKELLLSIPDQGIAYWYMDDGSLYEKKSNKGWELVISCCFETEEEALELCEFFKIRYSATFTVKRNKGRFSVRCGKKAAQLFLSSIEDYVYPFMPYKTFRDTRST